MYRIVAAGFYFRHKLYTELLSLPLHFLFDLIWHIDKTESVEHPIDVRHAPDVSQRLGSVHDFFDFSNILIRQHYGTPREALAALPAVDPHLLGKLVSPALFQFVFKWQARQCLKLVPSECNNALPEINLTGMFLQPLGNASDAPLQC